MLARIARPYAVKQDVRGRTPDERRAACYERSRSVVDELHALLEAKLAQATRKGALGEAIRYALTHRGLTRLLDDGRVEQESCASRAVARSVEAWTL